MLYDTPIVPPTLANVGMWGTYYRRRSVISRFALPNQTIFAVKYMFGSEERQFGILEVWQSKKVKQFGLLLYFETVFLSMS